MPSWDFFCSAFDIRKEIKMAEFTELGEKISAIKQEIQGELEKLENSRGLYEYKKTVLDAKA